MMRASLSNPIASDLDALRPSLLPSLLAAASRNAARGFSDLQSVRDRRRLPERHARRADHQCRRHDHGRRRARLEQIRPCRRAFDAKAAMLAALEAAMGGPMTAPVTASAPGLVSSRPQRHHRARAQRDRAGSANCIPKSWPPSTSRCRWRVSKSFWTPCPNPRPESRAAFAPSPFQAIERDFAFVVDAKVAGGRDHPGREKCRTRR